MITDRDGDGNRINDLIAFLDRRYALQAQRDPAAIVSSPAAIARAPVSTGQCMGCPWDADSEGIACIGLEGMLRHADIRQGQSMNKITMMAAVLLTLTACNKLRNAAAGSGNNAVTGNTLSVRGASGTNNQASASGAAQRCRDAHGHFTTCGSPNARPGASAATATVTRDSAGRCHAPGGQFVRCPDAH